MEYQALYRKYRPTCLTEVMGQKQNLLMLKNAVLNNKISHAYIFSGPRGTGKTTVAKIFAKMVNCENINEDGSPCEKCHSCTSFSSNSDIIELDAASNNGVDEIREIRDKVKLVPNSSKYKVYIIDEVHMMTNQAFNALLKTLEEPPKHIIFILATTEYHKIPLTITSRCQKFNFTKISVDDIVEKLKFIIEKENKTVDTELLEKIAVTSDGGLRDAINLLDQMFGFKNNNLTVEDFNSLNKSISDKVIIDFIANIKFKNKIEIIKFIEKNSELGTNFSKIIEQIMYMLKDILVYDNTNNAVILKKYDKSISKITELFSVEEIYDLILEFNDLIIRIKSSLYSEIVFMTTMLKLIDKFEISVDTSNKKEILEENSSEKIKIETKKEQKIEIREEKNPKIEKTILPKYQKEIINNAFCYANKAELNKLRNKINDLDNVFLSNDKMSFIKDLTITVVGSKYLIVTAKQKLIINKAVDNDIKLRKMIGDLILDKVFIAYLTEEEWLKERENYILNIKNGYKYSEIEIFSEETDIEESLENKILSELEEIVGKELIEYK